jgi:catechol 2,3-dioxygenase-like lactoylglutathione lyase family enzyme
VGWAINHRAPHRLGRAGSVREIDDIVLLLGVEDVKASKQFYVGRGMTVVRSFGGKYAEFASGESGPVKLALYKRGGLAKDLGVPADGTGSHRIVLGSTTGPFTDRDGFAWEVAASLAPASS